jgi:hypothetical protein
MAYLCEISPNQRVYLDNLGNQTVVTLMTGRVGQQQQASNSFLTGVWVSPPELFAAPQGAMIIVNTAQGEYTIQLQGGSMNIVSASGIATSQQQMQMEQVEPSSVPPMQPMQPMQPMTMGNMQMNTNPMEMRMGNMQMRMIESSQPPPVSQPVQITRKFCSQCGFAFEPGDRFCSSCGHRLV